MMSIEMFWFSLVCITVLAISNERDPNGWVSDYWFFPVLRVALTVLLEVLALTETNREMTPLWLGVVIVWVYGRLQHVEHRNQGHK